MKLALALVLNAALLAALVGWLRGQWRTVPAPWWRTALVLGLGARLAVGFGSRWHLVKDGAYMSGLGRLLTAQIWADPAGAGRSFWGDELHFAGRDIVYYGWSNTYFFSKLLAVLNLASLSTPWLNGLYLTVLGFGGGWAAARAVAQAFPATPAGAGVLAFVLWPSGIWWASGVTKEAALVGSGAALLAVFVRLFYDGAPLRLAARWGLIGLLLMLALLHFKMRYFFAAPLLALLAGLGLVRGLQRLGLARSRGAQVLVLGALLVGGGWLAGQVSVAFRVNKFTGQLTRIYTRHLNASVGRPHFEYPDLRPTAESVLQHAPLAAANALTQPWLGASARPRYVVAGLENLVLLALLAVALLALVRGRGGRLPFGLVLALGVQCLLLAVLLGISTPNVGSLARYRSDLLPPLLLLLLQNDYARAGLQWLTGVGRRVSTYSSRRLC